MWRKLLPNGLTQKWSGNSGSRTVMCPATPSPKPKRPKMRRAPASFCLRWRRSSSTVANVGGPVSDTSLAVSSMPSIVGVPVSVMAMRGRLLRGPSGRVRHREHGDALGPCHPDHRGIGRDELGIELFGQRDRAAVGQRYRRPRAGDSGWIAAPTPVGHAPSPEVRRVAQPRSRSGSSTRRPRPQRRELRATESTTSAAFTAQMVCPESASMRPLTIPPGSARRAATSGAASKVAIAPFLAFGLGLTLHLLQLVTGRSGAGKRAERGSEHVVGDRFERDVVAVVDEPDTRRRPIAGARRGKGDLSTGRDLHGGHGSHHIDAV